MMSRKYLIAIVVLALAIVLLAIPLPSYLRTLTVNRRMNEALSFPEAGYTSQHPTLTAEATMYIIPDEHYTLRLIVDIVIRNVGSKTLEDVMAAAKLHPKVGEYCAQGWITVQTYEPVRLQHGLTPPSGVGFSRSTPLRMVNDAEKEELKAILGEPVLIKLVHDDGIELLSVKPTLILR